MAHRRVGNDREGKAVLQRTFHPPAVKELTDNKQTSDSPGSLWRWLVVQHVTNRLHSSVIYQWLPMRSESILFYLYRGRKKEEASTALAILLP